jgi:murein DD-endopeptidase MepM/ murein hydrolase activator NlpD
VGVVEPEKRVYSRPVNGEVTKFFSDEILVYSVTMNDYRVHFGVDFASATGNPVSAFCDGVIASIEEDPLLGYSVSVDHGNGMVSVYRNLSEILPQGMEVGKTVKSGEVIAGVGESALIECAETPHLHFELLLNGKPVNPADYLELE